MKISIITITTQSQQTLSKCLRAQQNLKRARRKSHQGNEVGTFKVSPVTLCE